MSPLSHLSVLLAFMLQAAAPAHAAAQDPRARADPANEPAGSSALPRAAETPAVAHIPVRIVNGRLVVACQISSGKRIPANLFVEYEAPVGLLLHNKAAAGIECEDEDGTQHPITVHLPDLNVVVARREVGDQVPYERFTKWWSKELGENAVVGTLGARVLSKYHVTLDLAAGFLELSAPHEKGASAADDVSSATTTPITLFNDIAWVKVGYGDRKSAAMALATARYDTWIDADLAADLGHPAGDVGPVRMADVDVARFVAFRPEEVRHVHPDGVFGLTGLDFLRHFRVEIDRVNRFARWTPTRPASFPTADLEYFQARLEGRPEAIEAWLAKHEKERLAPEASELVVDLRLARPSDATTMRRALEGVDRTRPEDLKTTGALEMLGKMLQAGQPAFALVAGELGLADARKDRYPDAVHKVHARMGDVLLERGERQEAWKHLLSAAFGLPDDGPLNLDLARYYEQEGRFARAGSRYLIALLSADSGPQAIEGLLRVQPKIPDAESFSVDAIERLVQGKIQGFGVASRYAPEPGDVITRTVLSELYTNAHSEGEIGVTLARDGLRDHFGPEHLVLVTYHKPEPELDPLVNPLSVHMWEEFAEKETAHRFDDVEPGPPEGLVKHKERIFEICKKIVTQRLVTPSEHKLELSARADHAGIRGRVVVHGPAAEDDLVQILLVERGVLFPGKSKVVIHRNVARAALTKSIEGEMYEPDHGTMSIDFERTWESIQAENAAYLDALEKKGGAVVPRFSTRIDPRQARVVAIVRKKENGEVFQAIQVDPDLPEDLK